MTRAAGINIFWSEGSWGIKISYRYWHPDHPTPPPPPLTPHPPPPYPLAFTFFTVQFVSSVTYLQKFLLYIFYIFNNIVPLLAISRLTFFSANFNLI